MKGHKLYMVLLGCKPEGRLTEQHDIFFGIGPSLKSLIPCFERFWPEAKENLHIDAWREVKYVSGFQISVVRKDQESSDIGNKLFFLNLGGYRKGEFEEFHYKMLVVAPDASLAIKEAKKTSFYKETGFQGAASHVDDKFTLDIDDIYPVEDILHGELRKEFSITIQPSASGKEDEIHLGYLQLWKIKE